MSDINLQVQSESEVCCSECGKSVLIGYIVVGTRCISCVYRFYPGYKK